MSMTLFDAALTNTFVPTTAFMISGDTVTIDFAFDASVAANVEWFLEFAEGKPSDPNTQWFREVSEELAAGGAVAMNDVVRTFPGVLGSGLGKSAQFPRRHQLCRVEIRAASGTVGRATITAPFGQPAVG